MNVQRGPSTESDCHLEGSKRPASKPSRPSEMTWCWRPPPYFSFSLCWSFNQWNWTTCALWVLASLVICASVSSRVSLAPAAVWYASYDSVTIRLFAYYTAENRVGSSLGLLWLRTFFHIFIEGTHTLVSVGDTSASDTQGSESGHVTSPAVPGFHRHQQCASAAVPTFIIVMLAGTSFFWVALSW